MSKKKKRQKKLAKELHKIEKNVHASIYYEHYYGTIVKNKRRRPFGFTQGLKS
jgi:hypothetical protein